MKRICILLALCATIALAAVGLAGANHNTDVHSPNMSLLARFTDGGSYSSGTDIAFWGNYAIAGNQAPGGFRIIDISDPANPSEVGQFSCNGGQSDVSVWENLVFVSIDGPRASPACNAATGTAWEGIRIVDITNPATPSQIATVLTECGSHTHTLVPDLPNNRLLLYVQSYQLSAPSATCPNAVHGKISIVAVPLQNPAGAGVIATPSTLPAIGCHDVTVLLEKKLAGAACISETQLWDITNPAAPTVLSRIVNPAINIHHSTNFSFDGNTVVVSDELGGAAAAPGCVDNNQNVPLGAMWFYDITDRAVPLFRSSFAAPQQEPLAVVCTAHNANTVPLTSGRDVMVSAWYSGGTTVIDFTNPMSPTQIGFYIPKTPVQGNSWSSYWYRDRIYANNLGARGFDSLALDDPALTESAVELARLNPQTQEPLTPTAVAVRSFRAVATARGVVVRWRTASEAQLAGFNVYRSRGSGRLTRLNRVLIRALLPGTPGGRAYAYPDRRGRGGVTYRLEIVRLDGRRTWAGTTTARRGA